MKPIPRLEKARPSRVAGLALALAWFGALVAFYSAVLIRTQAVDATAGFGAFLAGLAIAGFAALVALLAMIVVWRTGLKGGVRAMAAVLIAALTLAGPGYFAFKGFRAPALAQASTDLADPPRFDRAKRERGRGDLPLDDAIPAAEAAAQRDGFPDLQPLKLQLSPEEVSNLALGLVEDRRWRVLGPTSYPRGGPPTGRIEAVAKTTILGLAEDISIRIREDPEGARVDMRSASRIGPRDFGSNAQRIKAFLADLATAANAAP